MGFVRFSHQPPSISRLPSSKWTYVGVDFSLGGDFHSLSQCPKESQTGRADNGYSGDVVEAIKSALSILRSFSHEEHVLAVCCVTPSMVASSLTSKDLLSVMGISLKLFFLNFPQLKSKFSTFGTFLFQCF